MHRSIILFVVIFSGLLGLLCSHYYFARKPSQQSLVMRSYHQPVNLMQKLQGDAEAGKKIYLEFCSSCHAVSARIDTHAPRLGSKEDWQQMGKLPMDTLLLITQQGVGAMPARGGCFECSDGQLRETIQYILDNS